MDKDKDHRTTAIQMEHEAFKVDTTMERQIRRRCDLHLLPPLMLLFTITFIDRTNIANAKIEGMTTDLNMKGADYNKSLWILNIPYIVLALPSTLLMKKNFVSPKVYLSGLMFCWALCGIGMGVTKSFGGLLTCRFLMGALEAGFVPGCAYLIGRYYKRRDFSIRYASFFGAATLAGAFGGLLAFAIRNMDGVGGYAGWRWIFIIEALMTVVAAGIGLLFIPGYPEHSTFLEADEKVYMLKILEIDAGPSRPANYSHLVIKECIFDPKIWLGVIAYFGADNAASSIVSFQPTILKSLGYTSASAQVHTIPVYMVALVILLSCSFLSDRVRLRYPFLLVGSLIGLTGWIVELVVPISSVGARYFGLFAISTSAYISMPILVVWLSNNMGGNAKAAFAVGTMIGLGNCGNLVSSNVFITEEMPRYRTGYSTGLSLNLVGLGASTVMFVMLAIKNRRRDMGSENNIVKEIEGELGDDHPGFRYIL